MTSRACAALTHHARASARMSPHGLSPSPYRPSPACSSEEAVTTTSIFSVPARPRARNSSGVSTVTSGWSVASLPYSSVNTCPAPAARQRASTHGDCDPMTSTRFEVGRFVNGAPGPRMARWIPGHSSRFRCEYRVQNARPSDVLVTLCVTRLLSLEYVSPFACPMSPSMCSRLHPTVTTLPSRRSVLSALPACDSPDTLM